MSIQHESLKLLSMRLPTCKTFVHVTAPGPMGGGSDDSNEAWTNQSRQPLYQHCARRRQPDDLPAVRLTVSVPLNLLQ